MFLIYNKVSGVQRWRSAGTTFNSNDDADGNVDGDDDDDDGNVDDDVADLPAVFFQLWHGTQQMKIQVQIS